MKNYNLLKKHFKKINNLSHAQSMLSWDEAVMMSEGGASDRQESIEEVASIIHELFTKDFLEEYFNDAENESLNEIDKANLREMREKWEEKRILPVDLVRKQVSAHLKCESKWRQYRSENNWKEYSPFLEEIFNLSKEEAQIRSEKLGVSEYDTFINQYSKGFSTESIDLVFSKLKSELPGIYQKAQERQSLENYRKIEGKFPVDEQKKLGHQVMKALGFDFFRGRVDKSHHPFCGGVPNDVRMTTRYSESDFTSSLFGLIHETGHGMYEQNLPYLDDQNLLSQGRSFAIHESQSLLFEMQMARSNEFLEFLYPLAKETFEKFSADQDWSLNNFVRTNQFVEKGFIRVEADEVTYPLHVILRYEIEKGLFDGSLKVKDIPDAWNQKMKEYLDLDTTNNFKDGCMQDVHWCFGGWGYFPAYTLGALMSAQIFNKALEENQNLKESIKKGNFKDLISFLRERIWNHGSFYETDFDLLKAATGESLDSRYFLNSLKSRYC